MFSKIVTLSLNPAIDITMWTDTLAIGEENSVTDEQYDAAGKSMNVSRALHYYGVDSFALVLAGRHNLHRYEQRLVAEKVNYKIIAIDGYIRENISIVQPDRTVTRLLRDGFTVEYEAVEEIQEQLTKVVTEGTLVVLSGKLPKGISPTVLKMICRHITSLGGKIALDTSSISLQDMYEIKPWVVKPNYVEACQYAGSELNSIDKLVEFAREVNAHGIEHCIVSLSGEGMVYSNSEHAVRVQVPAVDVVSAVGAGDCALAGFIMSQQQGLSVDRAITMTAAFGSAACLVKGTNPPPKLATANLVQKIILEHLS